MGDFLKTVAFTLLIILGLSVAAGIGLVLSALSSILGLIALGAVAVIFVFACVKESLGSRTKRGR